MGYTFRGMELGQLALWFFIYSFLGWCMECVVIRIQLKRWENRGFAKMPFCVIYGFGTFIAFHILAPVEHNYVVLFLAGAFFATLFEFATAKAMLKLFGEVWWNYDHLPFNYEGIICLESTIGWGFLAVFIFGFLDSIVRGTVLRVPIYIADRVGLIISIAYILDFSFHFFKNFDNKLITREEIEKKIMEVCPATMIKRIQEIKKFHEEHLPDRQMIISKIQQTNCYQRMELISKKAGDKFVEINDGRKEVMDGFVDKIKRNSK